MSKPIPQITRGMRIATLSVFLGFGLAACSDDSDQMEEPIQTSTEESYETSGDDNVSLEDSDGEFQQQELDGGEEAYNDDVVTAQEIDEDLMVQSDDETPLEDDSFAEEAPEESTEFLVEDTVDEDTQLASDEAIPGDQEEMYSEDTGAELETEVASADLDTETYADTSTHNTTDHASSHTSSGEQGKYVIQAGDTLGKISYRIFGTASRWQELADANGVQDPTKIFPGDELTFDLVSESATRFANALKNIPTKEIVVNKGDTLTSLAKQVLGPKASWKQLYAYNKDKLQNPNRIYVGMRLTYVPSEEIAKVSGVNGLPQSSEIGEQIAADIGD